jgi:hypothetical protein
VNGLREGLRSLVCNTDVVNIQDNETEASHVPEPLSALSLLVSRPASLQVHAEHYRTGTELVSRAKPSPSHTMVVKRYAKSMDIVNTLNGAMEGSYSEAWYSRVHFK